MRLLLIIIALFVYWLVLSGHYEPWLVAFGIASSIAVVLFAWVKGITDAEGFPIHLVPAGLTYWPWLLWQIVLSAVRVTKLVIDPALPISPTITRVDALPQTAVGITTYANSITLTPGTISLEVAERDRTIWVHAIERAGAEGFEDDEMNRRVAVMDGTERKA